MLGEDRSDVTRDLLVDLKAWLHEDQVRALPLGRHRWHRGANPELARLIAGSGHDAALLGSAHGDRLATQVRIVPLLHRCVEGIHVDMDDLAVSHFGSVLILIRRSHVQVILRIRCPEPFLSKECRGNSIYLRQRSAFRIGCPCSCGVDLRAISPVFWRKRHHSVMELGRDGQETFRRLLRPLPEAVVGVHHKSSRRPRKKGWRTFPSADFARYSISARSLGSTQMPLCAMRVAYGCVLRISGFSLFCKSAAEALSKPWSTLPA